MCLYIGTRLGAGRVSHEPILDPEFYLRAAADFPEDAKDPHMTAYIESARMMGRNWVFFLCEMCGGPRQPAQRKANLLTHSIVGPPGVCAGGLCIHFRIMDLSLS